MSEATTTRKTKAAKASSNGKATLTRVQHRILVALTAAEGHITRKEIMARAFNGNSVNLKPILGQLTEAKLVSQKDLPVDGGKPEIGFIVTATGKKAAAKPAPQRASSAEHQSLPKVGGTFTRSYKGQEIEVRVVAEGFQIGRTTYSSLTAAAKGVRGSDQEVNGWKFFGLTK